MPIRARFSLLTLLAASGLAITLAAAPVHADDPALKGPAVKDRNVPGVEGEFGGERKRFANEQRLPPKVFRDALEALTGPDAPADTRLSDDQDKKFRAYIADFQKAQKDYQAKHRDEIRSLREKAADAPPAPRKKDTKNAPADQAPTDMVTPSPDVTEAIAARDRLKQINDGQPKIEDVYTKVWAELSEPQRKAIDAKIDEFRDQQSKERQERYVRDRLRQRQKGAEGAKRPDGPGGPDGPRPPMPPDGAHRPGGPDGPGGPMHEIAPERRDRLLNLFSRLRPDQQDELLRRIEERLNGDGEPRGFRPPDNRRRPPRPGDADRRMPPPMPPDQPPVPGNRPPEPPPAP